MANSKYKVNKIKQESKIKTKDIKEGYNLISKKDNFVVNKTKVSAVKVTDKELVENLVHKKVEINYQELLDFLAELLIADDDTGQSARIMLDKIEFFRQQIKNKYKDYLTKKELALMAKQLTKLQKEARLKFIMIQNAKMFQNRSAEMESESIGKRSR